MRNMRNLNCIHLTSKSIQHSVIRAWKMILMCMCQSHVRAVAHAGLMVWHWYALMHKCMNATRAWKWAIKLKYLNKGISLRYSSFTSHTCPLLNRSLGIHLHLWYLSATPEWLPESDLTWETAVVNRWQAWYSERLLPGIKKINHYL